MESRSLDSPLEPEQPQKRQNMTLKQSSWLRLTSSWNDVGSPLIGYYDVLDSHNTTTLKSYRKCSEKDIPIVVCQPDPVSLKSCCRPGPRQGRRRLLRDRLRTTIRQHVAKTQKQAARRGSMQACSPLVGCTMPQSKL